MDTADPNSPIVSTARAVHRVPLGELADHAGDRAECSDVAFNSSI